MLFSCSAGCGFTTAREADLIQHYKKATSPACIQAGATLQESIRRPVRHDRPPRRRHATSSPASSSHTAQVPIQEPGDSSYNDDRRAEGVQPSLFEGDFFGSAEDYQDYDFPFEPSQNLTEDVPQVDDPPQGVTEVDEDDEDDEEIGLDTTSGKTELAN